jgi:hypothetical protein
MKDNAAVPNSATVHLLPSVTAPSVFEEKRKLSNGLYLIRTPEAYKELLKDLHPGLDEKFYPTDYPKAFPCLVKLYNRYQWKQGLSCEWQTVEQYKDKLQRQLAEVENV